MGRQKTTVQFMTVRDALAEGRRALASHDIDTPDLDASLLLAHSMNLDREHLYMELSSELKENSLLNYRKMIARRQDGEPVAWIIGRKEFWGRSFQVGPGVLTPRPDSEVLVEAALKIMDTISSDSNSPLIPTLHDCCTGPGTLGLSLKAERPGWEVSASDISEPAELFFSKNNRRICAGEVTYQEADLMEGISGPFNIIVSNPPYLTPEETRQRVESGWKEPVLALDGGGNDGLAIIRRLIPRAFERLCTDGVVLIEADPLQMPTIRKILSNTGFSGIQVHKDLGNRDRVVIAKKERRE